jgi:hypothetical protein
MDEKYIDKDIFIDASKLVLQDESSKLDNFYNFLEKNKINEIFVEDAKIIFDIFITHTKI